MSHWEANGKSGDWFTPAYVFDALGCQFDLDVAAPRDGPLHVPCKGWLSSDALDAPWQGLVFMNPPYGGRNSLEPWLAKFIAHGNGIALVPDRTSAPWFQAVWRHVDLALFTRKIRFLRPDGSEGVSPSNGTALLASGPQAVTALKRAAEHGLGILAAPRS